MYGKRSKRSNAGKRKQPSTRTVVRMVKQIRPEVKEIVYPFNALPFTSLSSFSYGSGAAVSSLAGGISAGTGRSQRVGNRIRVIGIQLRLAIQNSDAINNVRLLVVKPKNGVITGASVATLAQNVLSGTASSTSQWLGPVDNDRYRTLFDGQHTFRTMPLDGNSASTTLETWMIRKFMKCDDELQWDSEGNNDPTDFILLALSDSAVLPHPGAIAGFVKLFYTDN